MIEALLHGKLSRDQENMEDLLTSMVFGTLNHLPPTWIGRFLALARTPDGDYALASLASASAAKLSFWPQLRQPECAFCEPDLIVEIRDAGGMTQHVLVEAKFRSGKSSVDDGVSGGSVKVRDQLGREWENLLALHGDRSTLVYPTAHYAIPHRDIRETQEELRSKGRRPAQIVWLSWRDVFLVSDVTEAPAPMLELLRALDRLGLQPFRGVLAPQASTTWRFNRPPWSLGSFAAPRSMWSFRLSAASWRWPTEMPNWSFE